jgi:DNA polymerase
MMTREDILRELELLPFWQLRTPATAKAAVEPIAPMITTMPAPNVEQEGYVESISAINSEQSPSQPITTSAFRHLATEDGKWLFVLADSESNAQEQQLLKNIFKAMRLNIKQAGQSENIAEVINTTQPKLLICMGQAAVQDILQTSETLDSLRGRLLQFKGISLLATYAPAHLLANSLDKAKTWDDLCMAMQFIQDLKS